MSPSYTGEQNTREGASVERDSVASGQDESDCPEGAFVFVPGDGVMVGPGLAGGLPGCVTTVGEPGVMDGGRGGLGSRAGRVVLCEDTGSSSITLHASRAKQELIRE
jgi:hypothetical protein